MPRLARLQMRHGGIGTAHGELLGHRAYAMAGAELQHGSQRVLVTERARLIGECFQLGGRGGPPQCTNRRHASRMTRAPATISGATPGGASHRKMLLLTSG